MLTTPSIWVAEDGTELGVAESKNYFTVTSKGKTWYWLKSDGSFDGTSWDAKQRIEYEVVAE